MKNYIFLLKETYIPETNWTLFANNIFEVNDSVINMSYPNFKCDGIPLKHIHPDNYVMLNEGELHLASILYEPKNV